MAVKNIASALFLNSRLLTARYFSTNIQITEEGKRLSVTDDEGRREYYVKWLRHNCQCRDCLSSSGQVTVGGVDLRGDLVISQASINGESLTVHWNREGSFQHEGQINLKWLKDNTYSDLQKKCSDMEPLLAPSLPEESYKDIMNSEEGLWRWLKVLNHYGLCLVTDIPDGPEEIVRVAERISHVQKTIYGKIFNVKSEDNPINIAYSNYHLDCHSDLVYYQSPPGLQLLHCYRRDKCIEGGTSILVDGYGIAIKMKELYPGAFSSLTKLPATFQKIHFERDDPVMMVYKQPHFMTDRTGRVIKINWAPYFCGPLTLPEHDLKEYYDAYEILDDLIHKSIKISHSLDQGQALVFNNQRILHGRTKICLNGGIRHLKGVYVNIDEFVSKFAVLSKQLKEDVPIKHVLNGCHYM